MSNLVPIKALFDFEKGQLQSSKNTAGEYTFITASAEWKTHETYTHDCEALIFAMAASGSLGRTHYFDGKFISSDLCFILTPKEKYKNQIDLKFYHTIFNDLRESIVKQTATGTSKISINRANFGNFEIPFFDKEHQESVRKKLGIIHPIQQDFSAELKTQSTLIAKLRSSILSDAVSGRLVSQDPTDESASVLLERIKDEKERLIKEGELKRDKPLSPITADEIPYELPAGWVWCRLGELALFITSGSRDWAKHYTEKGAKFIRMGNLSRNSFDMRLNNIQHVNVPDGEGTRTRLEENDFLISITGEVGLLGLIPENFGEAYINQHTALTRLSSQIVHKYFGFSFLTELCQIQFRTPDRGIKNSFRLSDISNLIISLPPLAEQGRTVAKVEKLMATCDALEAEVAKCRMETDRLMQTILKEAFEKQ